MPYVPASRLVHLCEPGEWHRWQATQRAVWRCGPAPSRASRLAGGQLDQAGRAWQDARYAAEAARSEALASACWRVERGDLEAFGRPDTIRAELEPIEARIWPLLRKQPDGSWADKSKTARYYEVFFRVAGELLPEQALMAYGAADLLQAMAERDRAGDRAGWAEIDAAQRALAELRRGLLGELRAGNLVASCAPDPVAGLPGGILSAEQMGRLEWEGDRFCLRSLDGQLTALHDLRVKPAQRAAPVPPRKNTGKGFSSAEEAKAGAWLLAEMGKEHRPKQTRAMWHDEAKRKFPRLTAEAFDAIWRPAADKYRDQKTYRGRPATRTST